MPMKRKTKMMLYGAAAVLSGILLWFFLGKELSLKEDGKIPYISEESMAWDSVKQAEIYADGCDLPPTTVISDDKTIKELVNGVCAASEYKKVPEKQYLEGKMGRWETFYKIVSSSGINLKSLFLEKKEPGWEYVSHVMMEDHAGGRIGAVLFRDLDAGKVQVAFFDEDGNFQQCGTSAELAEQPDFRYLGNGTISFQVKAEDGQTYTHMITISIAGNAVMFKAEDLKLETEKTLEEFIEIGMAAGNLDGMALYSACPFVYRETEWELQTLVQEDMLVNGELVLDDRGHVRIQVISGADSYVLFDETVQLGMPEADAWIDEQENLHIVLRDVRTARYRVTDFIYDPEKKEFIGTDVLDGDGINYLGTTGN